MRTRPVSSLIAAILCAVLALGPAAARAAANTSSIAGTVQSSDGAPIADALVTIEGQVHMATASDAKGAFQFANVPSGLYTLIVTKAGYQTARNDDVAALTGQTATANVVLVQLSFSSLRTIASVSTRVPGRARINTSTASVNEISSQTFADQGQLQVTKVLNETPGIITSPYNSVNGNPSNGASAASAQTPQIRGALPYETESLIDGHPVSVGAAGSYSPNLINPWLLENVELVKGPGSMPEEINYAVNGTVNYRTLEPTAQRHSSAMFGYDNWGGVSVGFKTTGSTTNHKIGYAIGYVTDGAPGPLKNFTYNASQLPLDTGPVGGPYFINGQQVAMIISPVGLGIAPPQFAPFDGMGVTFSEPLFGCCYKMDTGYHSTSELAKARFNFSNSTSFTLSYLGGQSVNGNGDPNAYSLSDVGGTGAPATLFSPCDPTSASSPINCNPFATGTSYNCANTGGGPACGSAVPFDVSSVNGLGDNWVQQNLFQGEFRTTLGSTGTVLARYYSGALNDYAVLGSANALNFSMNTFGTIPLCPTGTAFDPSTPTAAGGTDPNGWMCLTSGGGSVAPVNTTFTGQKATFTTPSQANTFLTNDTMNGETFEVQELVGQNNTVTLAYDRNEQASTSTAEEPSVNIISHSPAKGSKQTFQTFSLRGNIAVNPSLMVNVGDYAINYLSHYSLDNGATWNDATHTYNEPRAALTWRPDADTSFRFATGGSVAPPYISLVSAGGTQWSAVIGGVPAAGWLLNANNGHIDAETAWSYDLGVDHRLDRSTGLSLDLYLTNLKNMFLDETSSITLAEANAIGPGCLNLPCLVSKTANLGHARYEGIELALDHTPLFGLGWRVQGSLQRAYTYDLPPFFYCAGSTDPNTGVTTPPGPGCINNTNLAIIPNVNFGGQPTALAGSPNGVLSARVPYALGYGELNWTGHYGQYYNLGINYFGNNNSYNVPPFAVVSANARWSIGTHGTSLQLSADNLTNAYANSFSGFFNGDPLPLVKGAMAPNPLTGAFQPVYSALTPQGNYGPASLHIILMQDF